MRANRSMIRSYADDLRLFPTWTKRAAILGVVALYFVIPYFLNDEEWAGVLARAGILAIGALSLNLLTGYTGQPSLGHAAFIGLGAFTAGYLGGIPGDPLNPPGHNWPLLGYLLVAAVVGAIVGFVVGLPALRLRGNYLVIVTLGLVFVALYVEQKWTTVSGGSAGRDMPAKAELYHFGDHSLNFLGGIRLFGKLIGKPQGLFLLSWGIVAVVALLVKNIVRTRPGRALQAVRDRDLSAEVVGVSLFRYKVGAFVISSAIAAMAGCLYGLAQKNVRPDEIQLGLPLSIQFLAIIVVGGIATIYGSVMGAVLVAALPTLIDKFADRIPLVSSLITDDPTKTGISKGDFSVVIYALLIIVFLVLEPRGLAGIWRRIQAYFRSWPFSY